MRTLNEFWDYCGSAHSRSQGSEEYILWFLCSALILGRLNRTWMMCSKWVQWPRCRILWICPNIRRVHQGNFFVLYENCL